MASRKPLAVAASPMVQQKEFSSQYRAELKRVLESDTFRHSESMRKLLAYLGEKSLEGTNGLKEYTIGIEAFKKPTDYNPQEDPTVRVHASKLRHKLIEYYGEEGADSRIRMEVPKGLYELRFHPRNEDDAVLQLRTAKVRLRTWRLVAIAFGACTFLFLALAISLRWGFILPRPVETGSATDWTADVEMIWQPFLESKHPFLVSFGTPLFTKLAGTYVRDPRINEWEDAQTSDQIRFLKEALKSPYASPAYRYIGVGEATGVFFLLKRLLVRKPDMILKRSMALSWDDIRASDVVFLGPPRFNPILKDIPVKEGFVVDRGVIRNLSPRQGEPEIYRSTWSEDESELLADYALIHRLQGVHDHGEIMVLASASTEGTWGAVEYVTKPNFAAELVKKIKLPSGKLPRSYQVLIRVEYKQSFPWKMSYVSHRVLQQPWKPGPQAP